MDVVYASYVDRSLEMKLKKSHPNFFVLQVYCFFVHVCKIASNIREAKWSSIELNLM